MNASNKQITYITHLLEKKSQESKTVEQIWEELKNKQKDDSVFTINYFQEIYFYLKIFIKTNQDASYIINCLNSNYSQAMPKLVEKFKELEIIK